MIETHEEQDTAWAETLPWDCLLRPTTCISPDHKHSPMANDPCALCGAPLLENQSCYRVIHGPDGWVCWRHVGRSGPVDISQ
jgi:hypothetical protein